MDSIHKVLTEEQEKEYSPFDFALIIRSWKPTPMLLKKGEMAIHHPLTVHGFV
jgi:hypothetical protein